MNAIHTDIQFTVEQEENIILIFLDIKIMRLDCGLLNCRIFRKPTHTDTYLNSVVRSLI